jgi:hypothetical protein
MKYLKFFLILLFVISGVTNCSKGKSDPLTNDLPGQNPVGEMELGVLPVLAFDGSSAIGLLGLYEMSVSSDGADVNVMPSRSSLIGESFVVSGDAFFTTTPCRDCLRIDRIGYDNYGNIIVGLSIKHPFEKGDPEKPPSSKNRLDLDVFDVAVVVDPIGSQPTYFPLHGARVLSGIMLNPDGYTSELKEIVGDNLIRPYKICYESENNNRFEMGTDRHEFEIILSPGCLKFELFVTMGYGASAKYLNRLHPVYYVPEFNRKAAWKVNVNLIPWYHDEPNTITIDVYDWGHDKGVTLRYPDENHPNLQWAKSDISEVTVEVQGLIDSVVYAETDSNYSNGWDKPKIYTATFTNENHVPDGTYPGLVKVLDSRIPGEVIEGGEFDTLAESIDGIKLQWLEVPEFATYQTFDAIVDSNLCGPITGIILSPHCPYWINYYDEMIDFQVQASSAGQGNPIVLYEMDFDYDGVTFDIDSTSVDGYFEDTGPFHNPNCGGSNDDVIYTVAFRATDSCDPPNTQIFTTCEIIVTCNRPSGWARSWDTNCEGEYTPISIDIGESKHAIITAPFYGTVDLDPESGVDERTSLGSEGCDIYLSAIDKHGNYCTSRTWGGYLEDISYSVIVKDDTHEIGTIYVCGSFMDTVDFDPGSGEDIHQAAGWDDIFLCKYDQNGTFQWCRTWGGEKMDRAVAVQVYSIDNITVAGTFEGTVDFDPGPGTDIHSVTGPYPDNSDIFLSQFDSAGNHRWTVTFGGEGEEFLADTHNPWRVSNYLTGKFTGTCDFDPGPDVKENTGDNDIFLCEFNDEGNLEWVNTWENSSSVYSRLCFRGKNVATIFLAGGFRDTMDFDPSPLYDIRSSTGNYDAFVTKLNCDGGYQWTRTWGDTGKDIVLGMSIDNDLYLTGCFEYEVDFDPGSMTDIHSSNGSQDIFVCSLDDFGNYRWSQTWGGIGVDMGKDITARNGLMYVAGMFSDSVDFNPDNGLDIHSADSGSATFLMRISTWDGGWGG